MSATLQGQVPEQTQKARWRSSDGTWKKPVAACPWVLFQGRTEGQRHALFRSEQQQLLLYSCLLLLLLVLQPCEMRWTPGCFWLPQFVRGPLKSPRPSPPPRKVPVLPRASQRQQRELLCVPSTYISDHAPDFPLWTDTFLHALRQNTHHNCARDGGVGPWCLCFILGSKDTSAGSDASLAPRLCWWHQQHPRAMDGDTENQDQGTRAPLESVDRPPKRGIHAVKTQQQQAQQTGALAGITSATVAAPSVVGSAPEDADATSNDMPASTELVVREGASSTASARHVVTVLARPTEAAAAACGYALLYGLIVGRGEFLKQLLPVAAPRR